MRAAKRFAAIALRAEALLPPQDEAAQFAFGVVVSGLDAFLDDEGPQCELVTEDCPCTSR